MTEEQIEDQIEDQNDENIEQVVEQPKKRITTRQVIDALSEAVRKGNISTRKAREIRQQFGIIESTFTKGKTTADKRKAKRKAQKIARRATRSTLRGQKLSGGKHFKMN